MLKLMDKKIFTNLRSFFCLSRPMFSLNKKLLTEVESFSGGSAGKTNIIPSVPSMQRSSSIIISSSSEGSPVTDRTHIPRLRGGE